MKVSIERTLVFYRRRACCCHYDVDDDVDEVDEVDDDDDDACCDIKPPARPARPARSFALACACALIERQEPFLRLLIEAEAEAENGAMCGVFDAV